MTEKEMVGWHHWLDGHEQALGVGGGQGSLACCSPWGHKESDMTEQLNWLTVLFVEMNIAIASLENSREVLQKLKNRTPIKYNPAILLINPKTKTGYQWDIYPLRSTAALFTIANVWTSRLLPCPGSCKQCCSEHWGTHVFFSSGFLGVYPVGLLDHMAVLFPIFLRTRHTVWRRLLRVPWIARRFNQSILKEISPEYSE